MASEARLPGLGGMVRHHRRKAALTQVELAQMAGVGKCTVYDIEKGKLAVQHDKLLAVLRVLNITVRYDSPLRADYEKSAGAAAQSSGG